MSASTETRTSARFPFLLRFFPSLSDYAFIAPLAVQFGLAGGAHGLLADGDTGWHIRTGEWILEHGRIPHQDIFSFTKPGQPWFAWEWLWDSSMALVHRHGGLASVVAANMLLVSAICLALYRITRARCSNDFVAISGTLLTVLYCSTYWLARPHLVTLLMLPIYQHVLDCAREGRTRFLWILPPLTILWTNLHGGFLAGLLLIGLFAIGELLAIVAGSDWASAAARAKPFVITGAACCIASLLNPYGFHLHWYIVKYLLTSSSPKYISEFQALNFQETASHFLEVMVLFGAVAAARSLRRGDFVHPLISLVWLQLGVTSARHSPIFMILTTPWVCSELSGLLIESKALPIRPRMKAAIASFTESAAEFAQNDRVERFFIVSALAFSFVAAALFSPAPGLKFRAEFDPSRFPAEAASQLATRDGADRVFSTDLWGGYLIYRLYPSLQVYIDGRSDYYKQQFVLEYLDILTAQPGWERRLDAYSVTRVLLPFQAPLSAVLKESKQWRVVADDGMAVLFARNGS